VSAVTRILYVGCPMWAHRPWVGRHLPAGTPTGSELAAYSKVVNAVEGNTTFYANPTPRVVARWADQADPGFRFVCKAPREVTHERRLRDVDTVLAAFVDLMAPLGPLLGGITLQLPASFGPGDLGALAAVLAQAPAEVRWSVEVRHPDFFAGPARAALDRLLGRCGAERVLLDSRALFAEPPRSEAGREAWQAKPRVPALTEALTDQPVVRFIGSDHPERTDAGLAGWQPIVADWVRDGRTPTFFVHTPDNLESPALARSFHAAVAGAVSGLECLPDAPEADLPPAQESLF
jgi:uncharacterized protein YecE (DUF72 family)